MALSTRFRAMMKREISAADVEALLRGSGQLEDLRQQIEQRRQAGELTHPGRPWETHADMGVSLAYFWVAQGFASIARELIDADTESDPGTQGYMPRVSHDQAKALLRQVPEYLGLGHATLVDPTYDDGHSLPIHLQPRIEADGRCPVPHLKGMLRGAQHLDSCAQVEVETYCNAAGVDAAPQNVTTMARRIQAELAKAQSNLKVAEQAVFPILNGETVDEETHEQVEDYLWSALETYVWLGQVVAIPSYLHTWEQKGHTAPPRRRGSTVDHSEMWSLTSPKARQELQTDGRIGWGTDELEELWQNKRWKLSTEEQRFLDETAELERQGAIVSNAYLAECPFNPIWTAHRPVTVLGRNLNAKSQFAYNHHHGKGELLTKFDRVDDFMACEDDD